MNDDLIEYTEALEVMDRDMAEAEIVGDHEGKVSQVPTAIIESTIDTLHADLKAATEYGPREAKKVVLLELLAKIEADYWSDK